jgi:hypothetical protein
MKIALFLSTKYQDRFIYVYEMMNQGRGIEGSALPPDKEVLICLYQNGKTFETKTYQKANTLVNVSTKGASKNFHPL